MDIIEKYNKKKKICRIFNHKEIHYTKLVSYNYSLCHCMYCIIYKQSSTMYIHFPYIYCAYKFNITQ